jgi:diguanylate cyclase (GGDEF)-like protein
VDRPSPRAAAAARPSHRSLRRACLTLLDVVMALSVLGALRVGSLGIWLQVGYGALLLSLLLHPSARAILVRATAYAAAMCVAALAVRSAHPLDPQAWTWAAVEIPLMYALALLLGMLARRREETLEALEAAHRSAADHAAELERAHQAAAELSRVDALTGIANRRAVPELVNQELQRSNRGHYPPGLLLLDCDRFKSINDLHGHGVGDRVLVEVARRLRLAVRPYDCVARWGGEEFCVIVPETPDDETLFEIADGLRRSVSAEPIAVGSSLVVPVTVSIGAVRAGVGAWTSEALIEAADLALYSAKRHGRDRVCLHSNLDAEELAEAEPEAVRIAQALALSASVREGLPELHDAQVAELASRVAERLGLSEAVRMRCRLGGWLHDVGKVAIPDSVLTKAGPLDADEWRAMRRHPIVGEQIVRRAVAVADAADVVRHHHERIDGTGYPDGLRGEQIPIEARIVAAADAYSALASERAYRPARSREDALCELRANVGTQLDAAVVDALCEAVTAVGQGVAATPGRLHASVVAGPSALR